MKRTTAVILAAVVLTLGACKKQNETNMNEEATPAATPAPAAMPESATVTPATAAESVKTMSPGMNMGTDTAKAAVQKMKKEMKEEKK